MTTQDDALSASSTTPTERDFVAVVDSMFDALLILRAIRDVDGTVVDFHYDYVNAAVAEHLGWEPEELIGSTLMTVVPHVGEFDVFASLVEVVETGAAMDLEVDWFAGPRTNGAFEIRARRLDDRLALSVRNVTERHELEATVAESEAHLRQVIDSLPVGVIIVDGQGTAVFVNETGRRIAGTDITGPMGIDQLPKRFGLKKEFTGEPYPAEELGLTRALRTGQPVSLDDIVVDRDGELIALETHATPLLAADGSVSGAVNVFEDVSQRRAQEALLARALAEITAVNEQLGEFASMAAHDLASPLRAIRGFAELLRDRYGAELGRDAREWIEFIRSDAERMQTLIDDLLAYARSGGVPAPTSIVDTATVAAEVAGILGPAYAAKGAELSVGVLPRVVGDRAALFVVLRNLLGNALKFLRADVPGRVAVGATRRGDEWVLSVSDNGTGVPDGERAAIFLPFQRGEASAGRGGNGLGLSICRRVVEYHGGRIWFEPTSGGGATFLFTLDAAPDD